MRGFHENLRIILSNEVYIGKLQLLIISFMSFVNLKFCFFSKNLFLLKLNKFTQPLHESESLSRPNPLPGPLNSQLSFVLIID